MNLLDGQKERFGVIVVWYNAIVEKKKSEPEKK